MAHLILLNKPFNVLCQFTDKEGRKTLADYVTTAGVYPAGRLDYDSEGLVLLTDSGPLQARIADPQHKMTKTYWVQVEGCPNDTELQPLRDGVTLKDGPTRPAKVAIISEPDIWERVPPIRQRANDITTWLQIEVSEGRNRQVRRMTAHLGFPTLRLIRYAVGPWNLSDIDKPGEFRCTEVHMPAASGNNRSSAGRQSRPSQRHPKGRHQKGKSGNDKRRSAEKPSSRRNRQGQ